MCLLSLLYATIQPSLMCACSAFYMPQYSLAYCMPAKAAVCLLSLLPPPPSPPCHSPGHRAPEPSAPARARATRLEPSAVSQPVSWPCCALFCNTMPCLSNLNLSQYTLLYCETNSASLPIYNTNSATTHPNCNTIRVLQYNGSTTNLLIAIQF